MTVKYEDLEVGKTYLYDNGKEELLLLAKEEDAIFVKRTGGTIGHSIGKSFSLSTDWVLSHLAENLAEEPEPLKDSDFPIGTIIQAWAGAGSFGDRSHFNMYVKTGVGWEMVWERRYVKTVTFEHLVFGGVLDKDSNARIITPAAQLKAPRVVGWDRKDN